MFFTFTSLKSLPHYVSKDITGDIMKVSIPPVGIYIYIYIQGHTTPDIFEFRSKGI